MNEVIKEEIHTKCNKKTNNAIYNAIIEQVLYLCIYIENDSLLIKKIKMYNKHIAK